MPPSTMPSLADILSRATPPLNGIRPESHTKTMSSVANNATTIIPKPQLRSSDRSQPVLRAMIRHRHMSRPAAKNSDSGRSQVRTPSPPADASSARRGRGTTRAFIRYTLNSRPMVTAARRTFSMPKTLLKALPGIVPVISIQNQGHALRGYQSCRSFHPNANIASHAR